MILPSDKKLASAWQFKPDLILQQKSEVEVVNVLPPFDIEEYGLKTSTLRVLRILVRLKTAHTSEITSLAGFSKTYVRQVLKDLQARGLIEWKQIGKYDGWAILNKGLRLAQRSWNVPKGARFSKYRTEYRYAAERHRRKARMWRAWLETDYEEVKIWECWTEVPLHKWYSRCAGVGNLPRERNAFLVGGR
ncbi:MAG: MarR family transcriptional regulator [Anaerolineales bacterium]|nr:MarR family transcriptional regulator [Anaerolineales bacterium]